MLLPATNDYVLGFLFLSYHIRHYAKEKNVKLFCFVLLYQC